MPIRELASQSPIRSKSSPPHGQVLMPMGLGDPSTRSFAGNTFPQERHSTMHRDAVSVFDMVTQSGDSSKVLLPMILWGNTTDW